MLQTLFLGFTSNLKPSCFRVLKISLPYSNISNYYVFCRLFRKLSGFDPIRIKSFMLIFYHRISPKSLLVEF
jgi:hypothetical protein